MWHTQFEKKNMNNVSDQKWTFGIRNETSDLVEETETQKRETKAKTDLMRNFVDDVQEEHHC